MPVSPSEINEFAFASKCSEIDAALKLRTSEDEETYISISDLPDAVSHRIYAIYTNLGWKVEYQYCAGEYDDLWFSYGGLK